MAFVEEVTKHLKIGKSTIYQVTCDGKVQARKLGRTWVFDVEDLDAWLKNGQSIQGGIEKNGDRE